MSDVAISVDSLSKKYRIGSRLEKYKTLRETIAKVFSATVSRIRNRNRGKEIIWALKDVSFEIKRGQVVGIIGRNGAGKSTLMKILSRITEPTSGFADIYGRIGSLLEVGTGFHGDLTGRENVYLSGAIMGMRKNEIVRKFEEIVSFAEMEKFIDTPVKRYSSGMYMRLAFAVAAHLESEILLVDEVLAVGDAPFQKKCLGKMEDVSKKGRTVLFISHNMAAVQNLCTRAIVLAEGRNIFDSTAPEAIDYYLRANGSDAWLNEKQGKNGCPLVADEVIEVDSLWIKQDNREPLSFLTNRPVTLGIRYRIRRKTSGLRIGFDLYAADNILVFRSFCDDMHGKAFLPLHEEGVYCAEAIIPENFLNEQEYRIELAVGIHMIRWISKGEHSLRFHMLSVDGVNKAYADKRPGIVLPELTWNISR
jgi:lipopolysaccharide transport system ATP-binding protein